MTRLRSVLYLPASNARAIAKARTLACDAVVLDLEDAVAPDQKAVARQQAVAAIAQGGWAGRTLVVRVNGIGTPWSADDCAALREMAAVVLLPKANAPADLAAARKLIGAETALWAMIETCAGVLELPSLSRCAADHGLTALVAGTNDLAKEMRCRLDLERTPLLPVLSQIVVAARAAGIAAYDGVCNALDDPPRLAMECRQSAALGFDGKTLIHPAQIEEANAAFAPTATEIAWARAVVAAFGDPANATLGAIRLDGAMVERLHVAEAEQLLAASRA